MHCSVFLTGFIFLKSRWSLRITVLPSESLLGVVFVAPSGNQTQTEKDQTNSFAQNRKRMGMDGQAN